MRKVIFTTITIFAVTMMLTGFKNIQASSERKYGGSASVSVIEYEVIFTHLGAKRGKELSRYTLNATVDCEHDDSPAAKKALSDDLDLQKTRKAGATKEIVFSGAIVYDINSCNK